VLLGLLFLGPPALPAMRPWPLWVGAPSRAIGIVLVAAGVALFVGGIRGLGPNLTPFPAPRPDTRLVDRGAYRVVRHPIYAGAVAFAFGWALVIHGWLTLVYAALLFAFFDLKAAREEGWLMARFPEYATYRKRVRKLIPYLY
jgi:protein-S-isoprenylcysteine O-methyltransferase Ste14